MSINLSYPDYRGIKLLSLYRMLIKLGDLMVMFFVFQLQKDPESKEVEVKRYDKGGYFGGNHKISYLNCSFIDFTYT